MPLRLKADFSAWLHDLRRREIDRLFRACPERAFARALELGAGDGFVSTLLCRYTQQLLSTDYAPLLLQRTPPPGVAYRVVDADRLAEELPGERFDLVFSSNLLEHLPRPEVTLAAVAGMLTDDGLTMHLVPTRTWLVLHFLLHVPNKLANVLQACAGGGVAALRGKLRGESPDGILPVNNPKSAAGARSLAARLLLPAPHGSSPTLRAEWQAFADARWRKVFAAAGLEIIATRRGICSSGHGFGWERLRRLAECCGLASERAYIAVRRGRRPAAAAWF